MEAFSLLKYWRSGSGGGFNGATTTTIFTPHSATTAAKTIVTAAVSPYSSDGEDGPYFDLKFGLPQEEEESDTDEQTSTESHENDVKRLHTDVDDETETDEISVHENDEEEEEEEEDAELKFSLTNSNECTDPSADLFFKGDLVALEPSTILLNGAEENSKFPIFLVKSATKFRVLLLKLKKSKSVNGGENPDEVGGQDSSPSPLKILEKENEAKLSRNLFVKLKAEECALSRDHSSKEISGNEKPPKHNILDSDADERKPSTETMNKYLKMVKPFYIRVSKRYVEKLKFAGGGGTSKDYAVAAARSPQQKQGNNNLQAGLKVVRKHLGKSRSASAAATAAPPPGKAVSERRDDSLLQVADGIQGAIMHCKKSFNASREADSSSSSSSILSRSVSDPSYEKSATMSKFSRASSSSSTSGEDRKGINNQ